MKSAVVWSAAGVGILVLAAGQFFVFSLLAERLVSSPVFFAWFWVLTLSNILLLLQCWKHRNALSFGAQAFAILWGGVAIWYWFFAPVYYFFTVNLDALQRTLVGFLYVWELVVVGGIFIALSLLYLRPITAYMEGKTEGADPHKLYLHTLRYPKDIALLLFMLSIFGYAIGTLQMRIFAFLPPLEQFKGLMNGVVIAIFIALFFYHVFEGLLERVRARLGQEYGVVMAGKRKVTSRLFATILMTSMGGIALLSLLIMQSWQMLEKENVLKSIRDDSLLVVSQLEQEVREQRHDAVRVYETLKQGPRGQILILAQGETLPPEHFSQDSRAMVASQSSGVLEDLKREHKVAVFFEDPLAGKKIVSVAFVADFYSIFLEPLKFVGLGALFVLFLTVTVAAFASFALTKRIRLFSALVRQAEQGNTKTLVPVPSADEIEELSRSFINFARQTQELGRTLRQEKMRYETIVADIGEGLVVADVEGVVTEANKAALSMFGYSSSEMLGKKWIEERARLGKEKDGTISFARKDGSRFPVHVTTSLFMIEGRAAGTVYIFRDITQEREIDRVKSDFVSMVSHQLRTPLAIMRWYAEKLLRDDGEQEERRHKRIQVLYEANQRMIKLIDTLLNVSRMELDTIAFAPESVDAEKLVAAALREFRGVLRKKMLRVEKEYARHLPRLFGDPNLLPIVFQNILSNAVKYTPRGGRIVLELKPQHGFLLWKVQDTGYGIPKAQQSRVFTKLFRGENVAQRDREGSGLGLYIAKWVVEKSGGRIWFESKENKGTTFFVLLPVEERAR